MLLGSFSCQHNLHCETFVYYPEKVTLLNLFNLYLQSSGIGGSLKVCIELIPVPLMVDLIPIRDL